MMSGSGLSQEEISELLAGAGVIDPPMRNVTPEAAEDFAEYCKKCGAWSDECLAGMRGQDCMEERGK
jgi:hypothetical protein